MWKYVHVLCDFWLVMLINTAMASVLSNTGDESETGNMNETRAYRFGGKRA